MTNLHPTTGDVAQVSLPSHQDQLRYPRRGESFLLRILRSAFMISILLPDTKAASVIGGSYATYPGSGRRDRSYPQFSNNDIIFGSSNAIASSSSSSRRGRDRRRQIFSSRRLFYSSINQNAATLANQQQQLPVSPPTTPQSSTIPLKQAWTVRLLVGVVDFAVTVVSNYCMVFPVVYLAGTAVGVPGVLLLRRGTWRSCHARSVQWGHSMGKLNAVFGGCGAVVRAARGYEHTAAEDPWSEIVSSMMAGAFLAKSRTCVVVRIDGRYNSQAILLLSSFVVSEGPQSMLQSALLYGGMVYLTKSAGRKKEPFGYRDEEVLSL